MAVTAKYTNADDLKKKLNDIANAVYYGTEKGIGKLGVETARYYKRNIDEGLMKYGRGHTSKKESVAHKAITITAVERGRGSSYVNVIQKSRSGFMMEVDKKTAGPFYAGAFRVPTNTPWARNWLRSKGYSVTGPGVKLTKNARKGISVTGIRPFKPMTETFNKFTASSGGVDVIKRSISKEIDRAISNVSWF